MLAEAVFGFFLLLDCASALVVLAFWIFAHSRSVSAGDVVVVPTLDVFAFHLLRARWVLFLFSASSARSYDVLASDGGNHRFDYNFMLMLALPRPYFFAS